MRILFYFPTDIRSIGGAERYTHSLAEYVARQGYSVTLLSQPCQVTNPLYFQSRPVIDFTNASYSLNWLILPRPAARTLSAIWPCYHYRPFRPLVRSIYIALLRPCLISMVGRIQPDFICIIHSGLVYSAETMAGIARHFRIPFGFIPLPHTAGEGYAGPRFRRLYRAADVLFALTQHEADWLVQHGASKSHIHVIGAAPFSQPASIGTFTSSLRQQLGLDDGVPIVLFLGRKVPSKGYPALLSAMARVWQDHPSTRFVFIGPAGPTWADDFAEHRRDPRVLDLGEVDETTRLNALASCDILCVPSIEESFGMIYVEAWQFGKPVIAANMPVTRELVEGCNGGLLVTPDADHIAQAIIRLIASPEMARQLGINGQNAVRSRFTWQHVVSRFERALPIREMS